MNMLEYLKVKEALSQVSSITQQSFGKLMHDDLLSYKTKVEIARKVELAGGYEALRSEPLV